MKSRDTQQKPAPAANIGTGAPGGNEGTVRLAGSHFRDRFTVKAVVPGPSGGAATPSACLS